MNRRLGCVSVLMSECVFEDRCLVTIPYLSISLNQSTTNSYTHSNTNAHTPRMLEKLKSDLRDPVVLILLAALAVTLVCWALSSRFPERVTSHPFR
jgi:hypothetical protein